MVIYVPFRYIGLHRKFGNSNVVIKTHVLTKHKAKSHFACNSKTYQACCLGNVILSILWYTLNMNMNFKSLCAYVFWSMQMLFMHMRSMAFKRRLKWTTKCSLCVKCN